MTKWMNERENLCCRYIFMLIMYCLIVSFLLYLGNIQDCCAVGHGDFSKWGLGLLFRHGGFFKLRASKRGEKKNDQYINDYSLVFTD